MNDIPYSDVLLPVVAIFFSILLGLQFLRLV